MSDRIVDCRGLACPQPVINTKKAVEQLVSGRIIVIVDNEVAKSNVVKFATANSLGAAVEEKDGHYYITLVKDVSQLSPVSPRTEITGECESRQVYLITRNTLGQGSEELGAVLMKSFMATLLEVNPQPAAMLFINSGVKLTVQGSPVLEQLATLAGRGVSILSCGTCLDYYQLKADLAVGEATNMYTIVETISTSKTVSL
ncbi:hypothetical protein SCACP_41120 [Sporomusa carbonis]|uniref:sulfurtransferase-like selenium metabolism protein YedF n=1 Tax=Sporomusa carbonis TaxID=3076075 RepID=UPI003A5FD81B